MLTYPCGDPRAPLLVLAHGAGSGEEHPWMRRVGTGLAARGISTVTFNFPYRQEGRRLPDRGPVLEEAFALAWGQAMSRLPGSTERAVFAGGKSMGGRIASQLAATGGFGPELSGLVCFGYPLHPPGKPAQRRDRHLPRISRPLLFVHGSRDPFGSPEEMHGLIGSLRTATLHIVEGGDHSLIAPKRHDSEGRALDVALDVAAAWMKKVGTDIIR